MSLQLPEPQRYAACIEYCGLNYAGWQRQKHSPSVQQAVEQAIARVADHDIAIVTAGRTDTGVHAIGQIIHFDSRSCRQPDNWLRGINTQLPDDISLIWTLPVSSDFHARFKARQRCYRYIILRRNVSPSILHGRVTWHHGVLDVEKMQQAAQALVGRHDFSAFRAAMCQSKNPVKEITLLQVQHSGSWIWIDVHADGFLHHMVRNIVGVLCRIGNGTAPVGWVREVLDSRNRSSGAITFPPDGLYLTRVEYDSGYHLPSPPPACRFW